MESNNSAKCNGTTLVEGEIKFDCDKKNKMENCDTDNKTDV